MATVLGTYTYDWGRAIPDSSTQDKASASTLWTLVHQLLGNLGGLTAGIWTCEGSSDGATGDTTNRWWNGGTFNVAKMPYGTGSNSGWMVIKSPAALGPIYILFVRGQTGHYTDGQGNWNVVYIARTPFTIVGTAVPTSTTQKDCSFYSGSYSNTMGWRLGSQSVFGARNCHLTLASDGAFFWSCSAPGGRLCGGMIVNPLSDTFAGSPYTTVVGLLQDVGYYTTGTMPTVGSPSQGNVETITSAYSVSNLCRDSIQWYSGRFFGWGANGLGCSYTTIFPAVAGFQSQQAAGGGYVGRFGNGQPWFDFERQEYAEFPIYLITENGTNSQNTLKGKLRDIYWAMTGGGYGPVEGTLEPSGAGPITRVIWGDVWVPASGTWTP